MFLVEEIRYSPHRVVPDVAWHSGIRPTFAAAQSSTTTQACATPVATYGQCGGNAVNTNHCCNNASYTCCPWGSTYSQCIPSASCTITPSSTPSPTTTSSTDSTTSWTCSYPVPVSSMCAGDGFMGRGWGCCSVGYTCSPLNPTYSECHPIGSTRTSTTRTRSSSTITETSPTITSTYTLTN